MTDFSSSIWVFGYGSLTWKPDISFSSKHFGYISGFKRRFWQSNTTHRGTIEQPGRVATLVKDDSAILWGVAYELKGQQQITAAMNSLNTREMDLGGYITVVKQFHIRGSLSEPLPVLVYTGTPSSDLYVGPAESMDQMALQIVRSRGMAGPNSEYVTKLADFVRRYTPEENDEHLFALDRKIRSLLVQSRLSAVLAENNKNGKCKTTVGVEHKNKGDDFVHKITNMDRPMCVGLNSERTGHTLTDSDIGESAAMSLLKTRLANDRDE